MKPSVHPMNSFLPQSHIEILPGARRGPLGDMSLNTTELLVKSTVGEEAGPSGEQTGEG